MTKSITFILDDERIFHPQMMNLLIKNIASEYKISFIIVTKIPKSNSIYSLFTKHYFLIPLHHLIFLACRVILYKIVNSIQNRATISLTTLANKYEISTYKLAGPMDNKCIDWLKQQHPKIIFSSTSIIFKKPFLKDFGNILVNRHSGDIRRYGGMWPIIHAIAENERTLKVVLHRVEEEVDSGAILREKNFDAKAKSLFSLYEAAFMVSAVLIEEYLKFGESVLDIKNLHERNYRKMPCPNTIKNYLANGGRFY